MDKQQLDTLIQRYTRSISDKINKDYDEGYVDGVVDLLGDLISFLGFVDLEPFAEKMEQLQISIHDGE